LTCACDMADKQLLSGRQADDVGENSCLTKKPKSLDALCYASEIAVRPTIYESV
jgi:hypothetical protein